MEYMYLIIILYVVYDSLNAGKVPSAPTYIFTKGREICSYSASTPYLTPSQIQQNCFWTLNTESAVVLGMLVESNKLVFATAEDIHIAGLSSTAEEKILARSAGTISDIAVDWISKNIYYVDIGRHSINVMNIDGEFSVTIHKDLSGLYGMTVDPVGRYLFWTTFGTGISPRIGRSRFDGSSKYINFYSSVTLPVYLCFDHEGSRLYWTDPIKGTIESIDRNGGAYKKVLTYSIKYPFALAVSKTHVAWTENAPNSNISGIYWSSKSTGSTAASVSHLTVNNIQDIIFYSHDSQPSGTNACSGVANGGCAQICIQVSTNGNTCLCSLGYQKNSNGKDCDPVAQGNKYNAIFIVDTGRGKIFSMDTITKKVAAIPIPKQNYITDIAIDPVQDTIIWADRGNNTIMKCNLDGSGLTLIKSFTKHIIRSLAVDYLKQIIFYSNVSSNVVESISYSGQNRKVVHRENATVSLVTDPKNEKLYLGIAYNNPRISRINYDGTGIETIATNVKIPEGLTLDYKSSTLFWVDPVLHQIESINTDGTNRKVLHHTSTYVKSIVTDLVLLGDYIYMADWGRRDHQLKRIHQSNYMYKMEDFGTDEFLYTFAMDAYPSVVYTTSPTVEAPTTTTRRINTKPITKSPDITTSTATVPTRRIVPTKSDDAPLSKDKTVPSEKGGGSNPTSIIVAVVVVIGVIAVIIITVVALYCFYKLRKQSVREEQNNQACAPTRGEEENIQAAAKLEENITPYAISNDIHQQPPPLPYRPNPSHISTAISDNYLQPPPPYPGSPKPAHNPLVFDNIAFQNHEDQSEFAPSQYGYLVPQTKN